MFLKNLTTKNLLILLLASSAFLHFFRIDYPKAYVFDEVYHAFTAKEYVAGHKEAWEWWTTPPPGVAYEWTHPPLAKEIMALSMIVLRSTDPWAWRIPGAFLGVISVWLIYLIGKKLFNVKVGLVSAFVLSLDGLNFVQSRTGMNDIYLVTFMLATLLFLLHKRYLLSAIFLGLALASKWTGLYLLIMIVVLLLKFEVWKKPVKFILIILGFILIPAVIYLASYIPFFWLGHTWDQFIELQRQMWYYHTHLKATHDYASPWWTWPLNLKPVWYYVEYQTNTLSNIFASGNPAVFWIGFGAILLTVWDFIKPLFVKSSALIKKLKIIHKNNSLFFPLLGFSAFLLPWALSPRIMFLYHYSPCIPFLSLCLGYQISELTKERKDRLLLIIILLIILGGFLFVYPVLTGIPIPRDLLAYFFKSNITKNPFGSL